MAVLRYEPTWHAVRIGADAKVIIGDGWSVSGEFALVPYAYLVNKDSHLLRQDFADLGPAPNVITKSTYAFGAEAEVFVNYAVTPNIEIGAGLRYWGLERGPRRRPLRTAVHGARYPGQLQPAALRPPGARQRHVLAALLHRRRCIAEKRPVALHESHERPARRHA